MLKSNNFKYDCYIPIHNSSLNNFDIYRYPLAYFLSGNAFLKKKSFNYINGCDEIFMDIIYRVTLVNLKEKIINDIETKENDIRFII